MTSEHCTKDSTERFERHRHGLIALAYRLLGSVSEAEDLVQDAWLRWAAVDPQSIELPRAWLARVVTNLCLDHLQSARARRERYVGVWLPEPWLDELMGDGGSPEKTLEHAQQVSLAFLLALEPLTPTERVAFVMREMFDTDYAELAVLLHRSEAACRQLVSRSRARVGQGATTAAPVSRDNQAHLLAALGEALTSGDTAALQLLLWDDTVLRSDGGGVVPSVLRPVQGARAVGLLLTGLYRQWGRDHTTQITLVNGQLGALLCGLDGRLVQVTAFDFQHHVDGPRITAIHLIRNPEKLVVAARALGA